MVSQLVIYCPDIRIDMGDAYDLVQPWRKTFPLCKPPTPGDKADAHRFAREFEEALDQGTECAVPFCRLVFGGVGASDFSYLCG